MSNTKRSKEHHISISIGIAGYNQKNPETIDDLLARADRMMYEHKKAKAEF